MSYQLSPLGDRLLVKLCREAARQVGAVELSLAHSDKKRLQPETARYVVLGAGPDVPDDVQAGQLVVARSDAGVGLSRDVILDDEHRLYRIIEYPEVLALLRPAAEIKCAADVLPAKVVV